MSSPYRHVDILGFVHEVKKGKQGGFYLADTGEQIPKGKFTHKRYIKRDGIRVWVDTRAKKLSFYDLPYMGEY